jgi:hypothetical protein
MSHSAVSHSVTLSQLEKYLFIKEFNNFDFFWIFGLFGVTIRQRDSVTFVTYQMRFLAFLGFFFWCDSVTAIRDSELHGFVFGLLFETPV